MAIILITETEVIESFDGYGLVTTDYDLIVERLRDGWEGSVEQNYIFSEED